MFFKNMKSWSKKKMWIMTAVSYIIYTGFLVVAPMITIMIKYDVFENVNVTKKVNGLGLILIGVFAVYGIILLKKAFRKLPSITPNEQRFKFGFETLINLMPFALGIYFLFIAMDEVNLAISTAKWCIVWGACATFWDGMVIKFIDMEWIIRNGAKFDKAKDERRGVV